MLQEPPYFLQWNDPFYFSETVLQGETKGVKRWQTLILT